MSKLFVLLLLCILFFSSALAQSSSSSSSDDGRDDDDSNERDEFRREVIIEEDTAEIKRFRSRQRDNNGEFEFRLEVDLSDNRYETRVRFESNEFDEDYEVRFEDYFEYDPANTGCITDLNNATSSQRLENWRPMDPCTSNTTADGSSVFRCTSITTDGRITVDLFISSDVTILDDISGAAIPLRPTTAKLTVTFNDTTTNNFGLFGSIRSESELEEMDESEEEREGFSRGEERQISFGGRSGGFFSWETTASRRGSADLYDVQTTNVVDNENDDSESSLFFCFVPRAGTPDNGVVFWDPKLAATNGASVLAVSSLFLGFLALFM